MFLDLLPNELLVQLSLSLPSIRDVLALSATCRRLKAVLGGSQRLNILYQAAETQFGPLEDITQLLTHNTTQPVHAHRTAPRSMALLRQMMEVGKVAGAWQDIYPVQKWKDDYENRRLLTQDESRRFRRALYRLWLYGRAFHNGTYPRYVRLERSFIENRALLLHNWGTLEELGELEDVHAMLYTVLETQICPSNSMVRRRLNQLDLDDGYDFSRTQIKSGPALQDLMRHTRETCPTAGEARSAPASFAQIAALGTEAVPSRSDPQLYLEHLHTEYQHHLAPSSLSMHLPSCAGISSGPGPPENAHNWGWGEEIPHYYVVQDMLKLDPGQILWLRDHAPFKPLVEAYVRNLGPWFENNGETFAQTLDWVLAQRADDASGPRDLPELQDAVQQRTYGVVREDRD